MQEARMPTSPLQSSGRNSPWGGDGRESQLFHKVQGPCNVTLREAGDRSRSPSLFPLVTFRCEQGVAALSLLQIPGWRKRGEGRTENACEQQRCCVIAEPSGRPGLPLAWRSLEDAHASSHLPVTDPCLSRPVLPLHIPTLTSHRHPYSKQPEQAPGCSHGS